MSVVNEVGDGGRADGEVEYEDNETEEDDEGEESDSEAAEGTEAAGRGKGLGSHGWLGLGCRREVFVVI